jgi:hypothetical protein
MRTQLGSRVPRLPPTSSLALAFLFSTPGEGFAYLFGKIASLNIDWFFDFSSFALAWIQITKLLFTSHLRDVIGQKAE